MSVWGQLPPFIMFVVLAGFTLAGAVGVAFSRNIIYAAFSLLITFSGMVGLFGYLSADFLAVVQLMIYVGGILVLILFAVMLTNKISEVRQSNPSTQLVMGGILSFILLLVLLKVVVGFDWETRPSEMYQPTAQLLGDAFLNVYILPFEVAGVLLLVALLAAVVVARKEIKEP